MTLVDLPLTAVTAPVTLDLYRDIHKAIRVELFAVTTEAGRLDPAQGLARAALATHVNDVVELLVSHAEHEDGAIQPALEQHLPALAEHIERDHLALESSMGDLREMAATAARLDVADPAAQVHRLYLALGSFTSRYLEHQDVEERVVMPALEEAIGGEAVVGLHQAILAGIPPEEMARSLALMLPAMNVDGRTELLGGMRAGAPAEVFAGVWELAGSVLDPTDLVTLGHRLDVRGADRFAWSASGQCDRDADQERPMSNADDLKGRVKEAAGDLTDNDRLEREGKADQMAGKAKDLMDSVKDKADDAIDAVKDKLHRD